MSCEEELNAWRQAERNLATWRIHHSSAADRPVPTGDSAGSGLTEAETLQRLAELTAAVKKKRDAYARCQGRAGGGTGIESLMRDATGKPLGGGAGPPM